LTINVAFGGVTLIVRPKIDKLYIFEEKGLHRTHRSKPHHYRFLTTPRPGYKQAIDVIMEQKLESLEIEDDFEDEWNSDDEWHETEGVPRLGDQFVQQYLTGRDALVAQEKKQRSG
jgi:hypothetical protein